jgi:arylformamidase
MIIDLIYNNTLYKANLASPICISIPLQSGSNNPNCFYAPLPLFTPVQAPGFIGDTQQGGVVNFFNVQFNPHGNGTHTECVGHISKERYYINNCLQQYHSIAVLITVQPLQVAADYVITKNIIAAQLQQYTHSIEALIIRTLPNDAAKTTNNYSNTNPAYIDVEAMQYIVDLGVQHLLIDLPSVDKEADEGKLAAHHIYWQYPMATRVNATITEMIYVPTAVADGLYLLNIQVMPIALDASSSNIILYKLQ